jgi:hypothetical protein
MSDGMEKTEKMECSSQNKLNTQNDKMRDSLDVEVLDGLLSIHHFARKWEPRVDCPESGPGPHGPGSGPDRPHRSEGPGQ